MSPSGGAAIAVRESIGIEMHFTPIQYSIQQSIPSSIFQSLWVGCRDINPHTGYADLKCGFHEPYEMPYLLCVRSILPVCMIVPIS
jgi:hypothetical protein